MWSLWSLAITLAPCLLAILPLFVVLSAAPPLTDDPPSPKEPASMNLLAKSRAGLNLTPAQRAILKLLETLLINFGIAALPVIAEALSSHPGVDWPATLHNALLLGSAAVAASVVKYCKAFGDSPLLSAIEQVFTNAAASLSEQAGLNEPVVEPPTDPTPTPTPEPPTNDPSAAALKAA